MTSLPSQQVTVSVGQVSVEELPEALHPISQALRVLLRSRQTHPFACNIAVGVVLDGISVSVGVVLVGISVSV